jgi:glutathione S-transferase
MIAAPKGSAMKIYDFNLAPNPKKLRVYLAEKGIAVPIEAVDVMGGQNRTPGFLRKNPLGGLPVLELDDGSCLPESLAIIEYFEELHPEPPMIGRTAIERARTRAAERICELGVLGQIAAIFQHTHPFMAGRLKQAPDAADNARARLAANLTVLDDMIGAQPFVCGARPTIADCTLFAAFAMAQFAEIPIDPRFANVARWHAAFTRRPSAAA